MATNPVDSHAGRRRGARGAATPARSSSSPTSSPTPTPPRYADVRLPAAGWGEKDGTVTNSERRISRQRAFLPAPGEARPTGGIWPRSRRRMGFADAFAYDGRGGDLRRTCGAVRASKTTAAATSISAPMPASTRRLRRPGAVPMAAAGRRGGRRRPASSPTAASSRPTGKAPLRRGRRRRPPRPTGADFPLVLNTGRVRDHWHTMTRTGKTPRLSAHIAEPFVEIHPDDAAALGIGDAALVRDRKRAWQRSRPRAAHRRAAPRLGLRADALDRPVRRERPHRRAGRAGHRSAFRPAGVEECRRCGIELFAAGDLWLRRSAREAGSADRLRLLGAARTLGGGWRIEFAHRRGDRPIVDAVRARACSARAKAIDLLAYRDDRVRRPHRFAAFDGDATGRRALSRAGAGRRVAQLGGRPACGSPSRPARALARRSPAGRAPTCPTGGDRLFLLLGRRQPDRRRRARRLQRPSRRSARRPSAGTNCGSCRAEIRGIIDAHRVVAAE